MKLFKQTLCFAMCLPIGFIGLDASGADTANVTTIENIHFTLADGVELERVADNSLIRWPIAATFHESGDLIVLECHWNRESVQKQHDSRPHKIVRLSDTDSDQKFDKRTVIADSLGFPEGVMVLGDDLLVTTPPQIMRLSDKDKDGFFETHDVWFDGATLTHCANDLHGPMMGPDGWVYWTKGAFAEQNHQLILRDDQQADQLPPSKAAHIYRRHPQGGPIERLMTGGMDNPSDLTFSPEGEIFFCSTFLHHPGNGLRDGIAHSPRGGLFGKPHQVIDGHWTTGPLLEPIANLGPAAPASVQYLTSNRIAEATSWYPASDSKNATNRYLVSAQFNLQKVGLHRLVPKGASFETETHDLLSADRIDFHPVDTLEESNGNLLVLDTGGWYDLCCPSSGSDQSIAQGGIYRLRIASNKDSNRPAAKITHAQSKAMDRSLSAEVRKNAVWQIARDITAKREVAANTEKILALLSDPDPTIQQTAAHIAALNRWSNAAKPLEQMLKVESPATIRAAIESLGVVGNASSIEPILAAVSRLSDDRYIIHSAIYALIELGSEQELIRTLITTNNEDKKYVALFALEQLKKLPDSALPSLVSSLSSKTQRLRELALRCLASKSQGVELCIPFVAQAWQQQDENLLAASLPVVQLGLSNDKLRNAFAEWLGEAPDASSVRQAWLFECLKQTNGKKTPAEWVLPIQRWIQKGTDESIASVADAVRLVSFPDESKIDIAIAMRQRAERSGIAPREALMLLAGSPANSTPIAAPSFQMLLEQLTAPESANASLADLALARSVLAKDSASALIKAIAAVPPLSLQTAIDAVLRCHDPLLDESLLESLPAIPSLKSLATERVIASLGSRPDAQKKKWEAMMLTATKPPEDIAKALDAWLEKLPTGDAARGYQVFRSSKAACSSCHQVGYIGGKLGPELSHIGKSRTRRDLVEAVVFPSFRMAQGFYPIRIRTADDEVFNGLLSKQSDAFVELLCGADKVCRIAKSDIEEQAESKVSIMPSGLDQQMTVEEFADLLAFLESKR